LAVTDNEVEFFNSEYAKAQHLKVGLHFIDFDEVRARNPLIETSHYRAAMFDPNDGNVDPSGVTQAYAKAARDAGAEIYRHTAVTAIRKLAGGEWELTTPNGVLRAEYIVNAGGLWAREVGRLMQVELPIVPMEHQYLITNEIPELTAFGREIPFTVDFDGAVYLRQEGKGLLVGTYELPALGARRDAARLRRRAVAAGCRPNRRAAGKNVGAHAGHAARRGQARGERGHGVHTRRESHHRAPAGA
jgi:dimethylglycine dehydrogenase